jgi:hypothetical protein
LLWATTHPENPIMMQPPKKPRDHHALPALAHTEHSFEARVAWARELGRSDAFDSVLEIWEASDRELAPVRARRERELADAKRSARARTVRATLLGLLAILAIAVPIATFAHLSVSAHENEPSGVVTDALASLEHDDGNSITP